MLWSGVGRHAHASTASNLTGGDCQAMYAVLHEATGNSGTRCNDNCSTPWADICGVQHPGWHPSDLQCSSGSLCSTRSGLWHQALPEHLQEVLSSVPCLVPSAPFALSPADRQHCKLRTVILQGFRLFGARNNLPIQSQVRAWTHAVQIYLLLGRASAK